MAELAIVAGLAVAGYSLARAEPKVKVPKKSEFSPYPPPSGASRGSIAAEVGAPPPPDDHTIAAVQQRLALGNATRMEAALDPMNQAVAGDRRFFISSQRKQNNRSEQVQQKMELFTGALNADTSTYGTWRPKREVAGRFPVSTGYRPVTSSGKGVGGVTYNRADYERFLTNKQHNVLPTAQIRVGPGIGIPLDQPAGNGFHYDMNRILPKNVNAYRLNRDMPNRPAAGGASRVVNRPTVQPFTKFRPVKFWTLDRRPLAPGQAAVTGHRRRSKEPRAVCFGTKRDPEPRGYLGIATHALTKQGPVPAHKVRATRPETRCDDPMPLPPLNVTYRATTQPRGAYAKNSYDCNRFLRQQREQTVQREGQGNVGGVTQRGPPNASYTLQLTKRALVPSFGCKRPDR